MDRAPFGALVGFCSVELASGMIVNDLRLMTGNNGPWVAMPTQKQFDRDGNPRLEANGKPIFNPFIEFRYRATSDGFSREIVEFIRAQYPDVENAS
jgi:hypothetical protein